MHRFSVLGEPSTEREQHALLFAPASSAIHSLPFTREGRLGSGSLAGAREGEPTAQHKRSRRSGSRGSPGAAGAVQGPGAPSAPGILRGERRAHVTVT